MSFLDEVRAKRKKLADLLSDEDYSGIREIVEELYPDRAHFIYELLQNAEDTGATEACFELDDRLLRFEHNGRPFDEDDVWGITNVGKSSKKDQKDKIGRFGVGFKAVFVYSETPHIWSPTYSFSLSNLVLPTELAPDRDLQKKTRFEFPFNNTKKPAQTAYDEIKDGLEDLAETTLLFLSNLESIRWRIGNKGSGEILRVVHSEHHVEVLKEIGKRKTASAHFLSFSAPVRGLPKLKTSVAFALDFVSGVESFDSKIEISKQMKIVPANPGRVAVYFPAEKESSGLRFHLHAPFVPELSRASIKDVPSNEPLFEEIAKLAAASLHIIRDIRLLNGEFLGVLPNPDDTLPDRYDPIRIAIIDEMNDEPLTPTHSKSHAPAKYLLQARASLKELLPVKDLGFLIGDQENPLRWAIGAPQRSSDQDRFLAGLAITQWDIEEFVEILQSRARRTTWKEPDRDFMEWLAKMPADWYQQMYALLYRELQEGGRLDGFGDLKIVKLSGRSLGFGGECYFPEEGTEHDEILPRVDKRAFSSGKSKTQQQAAKEFLVGIGVREVGEAEEILGVLKLRYSYEAEPPNDKTHKRDLMRFIKLLEKEPEKAEIFRESYIFKRTSGDWAAPREVFVDLPYLKTDLSAYWKACEAARSGASAEKASLSSWYLKASLPKEKLLKFARIVGAQTRLEIIHQTTDHHPMWSRLRAGSSRRRGNLIDDDWMIPDLAAALASPSEVISRLIWSTLCEAEPSVLVARFQSGGRGTPKEEPSSLVLCLSELAWIPTRDGSFVFPSEASSRLLPKGFPYDEGYEWLKAINFAKSEREQSEEHQSRRAIAKAAGFDNLEQLDRAKRFVALPAEVQKRMLADTEQKMHSSSLPESAPRNPERRADRVSQQAADAPGRVTEIRERSVAVGREDVKERAEEYLRQLYTNADGEMICQACEASLPFKLDDGRFYVEKVEFIPQLAKHHYQNYLALCPNHSAMFRHANGSKEMTRNLFRDMTGNRLQLTLAQSEANLYFTSTHVADLKAVIEIDLNPPEDSMEVRGHPSG